MAGRSPQDAARVLAARAGDERAFTALFQRWFDPCYDVAWRIVRDDGRAAEVAQDTFLVAWQQLDSLRDPAAFGGWVLRMARNRALNRIEHERRASPTDDDAPVFTTRAAPDDPAATVTRAEQEEMLWAASVVLGERDASVLDLHLRHGLDPAEIAEALEITPNAAHQTLHRLRGRLAVGIRAWVLWHHGEPRCEDLAALLADAGLTGFGRDTVRAIEAHAPDCDECSDRLAAVLAPDAMFAAVPLLAAGPDVRRRVAEALRSEGVSIDPIAAATAMSAAQSAADISTAAGATTRRPVGAWLAGAAATLVVGGLLALSCLPDDDEPVIAGPLATTTSTTSASTTTTSDASTTTSTTAAPSTTSESTTTSVAPAPGVPPTTQNALLPPGPTPVPPPPASPPPVSPPPVAPPVPPPPTTPAAPTVDSFTATPAVAPGGACPGGQWATTLAWTTTGATIVSIAAADIAPITGLPADGSTVACRLTPSPPIGGWTLTATGPGGTDTATA